MAEIRIYDGTAYTYVEVSDELAAAYAEMERRERLTERKETRRHQSLDKSLEHGFDIADPTADVWERVKLNYDNARLKSALSMLTEKQRTVVLFYVLDELSFREIGEQLGLCRYTVRDYYYNAVKKLKKLLS